MFRVVASWSGGKESCFACYKAISDGFEVSHLLNFISKDGRCMSHGLDSGLISAQSRAIEVPIVQREVTWNTYEQGFKAAMRELKQMGVEGAIFGDILDIHEGWIDRVCGELGIKPVKPLWGSDPRQILVDFIDEGFEAIVISAKVDLLGKEWLGRKVDGSFLRDLQEIKKKSGTHICGELGEYHTFVTDGPLFKRRLKLLDGNRVLRDGYWFLDVSRCEIIRK